MISATRRRRLHRVHALQAQSLTSRQVGQRLRLAPSTVRDYWNDPLRAKARARQAQLGVAGVEGVRTVAPVWKRGGPHRGRGAVHARIRARQLAAVRGRYATP